MAASMWSQCGCRIPWSTGQVLRSLRLASSSTCNSHQTRGCASQLQEEKESIVIPRRIKRDDLSVLRALSKTVPKDPTALPYIFHDDPYLLPRSAAERRRFSLSKESGKKAAQHIINTKPQLFLAYQHDQPKIEAFLPPVDATDFSEPSEEAILERIDKDDMQGALEIHQQLRESGHTVCVETNNALLDFLCFHGGYPPKGETLLGKMLAKTTTEENVDGEVEVAEVEEPPQAEEEEPQNQKRWRARNNAPMWKDGNVADQLFESMEERNAQSYNTMIRGLGKHGAHSRAFTLYNEMQQRSIQADVNTYNVLIEGSINIREDYRERWSVMSQLMKQMDIEKIRPNLETFNALLNSLRIMGAVGRKRALQTVAEMKACGVEPSLGTYSLLLMIFYKDSLPPSDILYDVMDTIEGQHFTIQHPRDVDFFKNAMSICLNLRDVELAYRVDLLLNTGDNCKLAGNYMAQNLYYGKFFHLICLMDNAESMFDYYKKLVPSALIPSTIVYMEMLRSLETACAYEHVLQLWEDICLYGHRYRQNVLELLVQVMATSSDTSLETKANFCGIAQDVISAAEESKSRIDTIRFGTLTLDYLVSICLQTREIDAAWMALNFVRANKKVPSLVVLEDFLQICVDEQEISKALACLRIAVGCGLTGSVGLADKIKMNFKLSTEQRRLLEEIMMEEEMVSGQGTAL